MKKRNRKKEKELLRGAAQFTAENAGRPNYEDEITAVIRSKTQPLAVSIRVLTAGEPGIKQKLTLISKELRIGLYNGLILGVASVLLVGIYIVAAKGRSVLFAFAVSGCIGVSLLLAMAAASATGTLIPLFFKKIKIDPAVASGPLITTVNDLVAVVTYYGLSWLFRLKIFMLG